MCGIAGKIYFKEKMIDQSKEVPLIKETLAKLHHRGPDDKGFSIDENVWLGATRLSIIDLSPAGHQPMKNEDGSLILICNGEIYNYLELKKKLGKKHKFCSQTDTEVVLHLYEDYGIDCLQYLRGMFAFAIWDKKRRELFIARDRIGKKPLKYFYNDKFFIFASELKGFIDYASIPKEIDWSAIDEFLTFGYVRSPRTGFKNIWKLPPAHYMVVKSDGEIITKRYWDLDFDHKLTLSEEEWEKLILNKLKETVKLRLRSDVPLGIHLSGGIDSSMITALASMESKTPVKTFSIGFKESDYNELPHARLVAKRYNTNHHEFIVKPNIVETLPKLVYQYEEPFADPSILPTWHLMQECKKYITVALNGDGGDEDFAGYRRYQVAQYFNLVRNIPAKHHFVTILSYLYKQTKNKEFERASTILLLPYSSFADFYQNMVSFINERDKKSLYTQEFKKKVCNSRAKDYLKKKIIQISQLSLLDQMMAVDMETYLPDDLLAKVDMAASAFSLEVRSPFLDHELVEFCAKMPANLKLKFLKGKYILKKIAKKLFPGIDFQGRKQAFLPPLDIWFRQDKGDFLKDKLLSKKFVNVGIFEKTAIEKMIEDHQGQRKDNSYKLFTLLCLYQWFENNRFV